MIKNIIFDIGNVLVKWAPHEVLLEIFPEENPREFFQKIRPIWLDFNIGKITEKEVINLYHQRLNLPKEEIVKLMERFKSNQTLLPGSLELLDKLDKAGFNLYSITDNVREIIQYHRQNSNFLEYFKDVIVSAEVGILKPDPKIYLHLIKKHNLNPQESVFIDDVITNVEGAKAVGLNAIHFIDAKTCEEQLKNLGIRF